ncbi:MAG: hypothetical protein C0627_01075 [Sulfurimonas sp.]|nr:MAG: hypothetical protein C0627_01075 [Sulfurimonas sp.]
MKKENFLTLGKKVKGLTLLYIEDNKGLQQQATKVFKKIFKNIITVDNGEDALAYFKKYKPDIVISDINMPKLNGLEVSKMIKKIKPSTKIIITSAFDDKDYLLDAIEANVSKYLKKPISITKLIEAIMKAADEINFEKDKDIFEHYIKDVFEHQDIILILEKNEEILIVNNKCLTFFSQESLESFREFFLNFDKLFLEHNNFLYNHDDIDWLKVAKENSPKLFNVKMADKDGSSRHFILKAYQIPKKEETFILSFDDITELNLLAVYDKNAMQEESLENKKKIIYNVFEIIKRNNSTIRVYNSYKGLNISNNAVLENLSEEEVTLKTPYLQQKVIKINNYLIIESELFPAAVLCDVEKVDFKNGQIFIKDYKFIENMPSKQEFIRVEPEEKDRITLFFEEHKISTDIKIMDVSVGGVKVAMSFLPAGFKIGDEVIVDMVFEMGVKPVIVNAKAEVKSITELKKEFEVVLCFKDVANTKKHLTEYVANRQMTLIREFKRL